MTTVPTKIGFFHIFASIFETRVRILPLATQNLVLPRLFLAQIRDPHVLLRGRPPDLRLGQDGSVE